MLLIGRLERRDGSILAARVTLVQRPQNSLLLLTNIQYSYRNRSERITCVSIRINYFVFMWGNGGRIEKCDHRLPCAEVVAKTQQTWQPIVSGECVRKIYTRSLYSSPIRRFTDLGCRRYEKRAVYKQTITQTDERSILLKLTTILWVFTIYTCFHWSRLNFGGWILTLSQKRCIISSAWQPGKTNDARHTPLSTAGSGLSGLAERVSSGYARARELLSPHCQKLRKA